jgi:ketosteroid isomerase-like protein
MTTDDTPRAADAKPVSARPDDDTRRDLAAVWAAITGMYQAYTAGDRERIDSFLDPEASVWDSATPGLLRGKAELDRVRDARPALDAAAGQSALTAYDQVIDVFGTIAVARYWLRVDFPAPDPTTPHRSELVRNTAILRYDNGRWLIVHLHEDAQPGGQTAT